MGDEFEGYPRAPDTRTRETQQRIFEALLARDTLPSHRFADIMTRLDHLMRLSIVAAEKFEAIRREAIANPDFLAELGQLWDYITRSARQADKEGVGVQEDNGKVRTVKTKGQPGTYRELPREKTANDVTEVDDLFR